MKRLSSLCVMRGFWGPGVCMRSDDRRFGGLTFCFHSPLSSAETKQVCLCYLTMFLREGVCTPKCLESRPPRYALFRVAPDPPTAPSLPPRPSFLRATLSWRHVHTYIGMCVHTCQLMHVRVWETQGRVCIQIFWYAVENIVNRSRC